jgi:hypothetical protein
MHQTSSDVESGLKFGAKCGAALFDQQPVPRKSRGRIRNLTEPVFTFPLGFETYAPSITFPENACATCLQETPIALRNDQLAAPIAGQEG